MAHNIEIYSHATQFTHFKCTAYSQSCATTTTIQFRMFSNPNPQTLYPLAVTPLFPPLPHTPSAQGNH